MKNYLILLFLCFQSVFAQVKFDAKLSKNSYALNEKIELSFVMNIDADNFLPPRIANFDVDGPIIFIEGYDINGKKSFVKTYKYYLIPKKTGDFVIASAEIEFRGKIFKSNPVKVKITPAINQQNNTYASSNAKSGDGVFLVAELSNSNPFVNEPIKVTYKLYFDPRVVVGNISNIKKPKNNGFWSQFFENKMPQAVDGNYKGKNYAVVDLASTILYPLEAGKKTIEPYSFDAKVEFPTNAVDFFGEQVYTVKLQKLSSGLQNITVKPLPENGKPTDFSGAVGKFNFNVTPSKTTLKTGESLDLNVSVSGNGNLKLFQLPKPIVDNSLEMYDPEHKENVSTTATGMSGNNIDKYTIIPQEKGNFTIKPIRFSYFDLETKSYKTISSSPIVLNVAQGDNVAISQNSNANNTTKNQNKIAKTFAFIKQKTKLTSINSDDFLGSGMFYSLLFLPFLAIPLLIVVRKRKEVQNADFVGNKIKKSDALAKKYLSEAKNNLNNKELFYVALEKSLHNFLKAKLNIETSEMSKDKVSEILLSRNANQETVVEFTKLTENCELARYAPTSNVAINADYSKAVEIISSLEKQIK